MTRTFTASPRFGFGFQTEFCDDACGQSDISVIAIVNRGSVTRIAFFILVESRRGELLLHPVTKGPQSCALSLRSALFDGFGQRIARQKGEGAAGRRFDIALTGKVKKARPIFIA